MYVFKIIGESLLNNHKKKEKTPRASKYDGERGGGQISRKVYCLWEKSNAILKNYGAKKKGREFFWDERKKGLSNISGAKCSKSTWISVQMKQSKQIGHTLRKSPAVVSRQTFDGNLQDSSKRGCNKSFWNEKYVKGGSVGENLWLYLITMHSERVLWEPYAPWWHKVSLDIYLLRISFQNGLTKNLKDFAFEFSY